MKKLPILLILMLALLTSACDIPQRLTPPPPTSAIVEETLAPTETSVSAEAIEGLPPYEPEPAVRSNVRMSEFQYERPDPNDYRSEVQKFLGEFGAAETAAEQLALYLDMEAYAMRLADQLLYAQMCYMADVNEDTQVEYDYASSFITEVIDSEMMVYEAVLASPFLPEMSGYLGENVLQDMHAALRDYDPQITTLQEQARKCNSDYILTIKKHEERTLLIDGKEMSPSEVFTALYQLPENDSRAKIYSAEYMRYFEELNRDCDEIYARLLAINTEIARIAGYENYPAYRLSGGSYSMDEIKAFISDVKETFVPVIEALTEQGEALSGGQLSSRLYLAALCPPYLMIDELYYDPDDAVDVAEDKEFAAAKEVLNKLLPIAGETVAYLEEMEMMDVISAPEKSQGGFTAFFYGMAQPYVFMDYADVNTIIHETGHALAAMRLPRIDIPNRFNTGTEIAEIHSMGLEVLAQRHYDILYGDSAPYAVLSYLFEGLYRSLTQAMYYEFELLCYENPDMTREGRNALYALLTEEYSLAIPGLSLYGDSGLDWVTTPHHFESPLYTIDYTLAQMASFQLWEAQDTDPDLAMSLYLAFLDDTQTLDLRERLRNAGLSDVFDSQNTQRIADKLLSILTSDEYTMPLIDYLRYIRMAS